MFIDPALEVKGFGGRRHVMLPLLVGILQDALEFIETSVTGWNCVQISISNFRDERIRDACCD
jgi:hypothetical protein